jgi:hypothetical protein
MRFINTNGLSFLGPGSEWFWTAVSAIALMATLLAIYRQVLLQRGLKEAQQMQEVDQRWSSERYLRARLTMALTLREGGDLYALAATTRIAEFWENLGSLVRAGHVSRWQMDAQWNDVILIYWTMLEPCVRRWRVDRHWPIELQNFEWLAKQILKERRDHSYALTPLTSERIEAWIALLNEDIALEEALRRPPANSD